MSERRRRDANEIKYEVLMSSISGKRKTHIMYESGLNLKQLNLYLGELMAHGALEFEPQEKRYFITERGRAFMSAFGQYRETVSRLGKEEAALRQFFSTTASKPLVTPADRLSNPARIQRHEF